jgi:hypothetical protein
MQINLMTTGTKKSTSVDRLLKGVVTRAKRDAAANTAIKFGQQLRSRSSINQRSYFCN